MSIRSELIKPEFNQRDIRSYVIRGGRITDAQQNAFDLYWTDYGLSLHDGLIKFEEIFGNRNPVVVEIGYGMGDSLLTMAEQEPDKNFIGIEVHLPGVGRLINEAGKRKIFNLKTFCADAIDVLTQCIPEKTLARVQIFFPDPWHKKRHHKRRLIQSDFITLVESRLGSGGIFHLCTDWEPYAEHMRDLLAEFPKLTNMATAGHYSHRPTYRPITRFESRGEKLGQPARDLLFRKK